MTGRVLQAVRFVLKEVGGELLKPLNDESLSVPDGIVLVRSSSKRQLVYVLETKVHAQVCGVLSHAVTQTRCVPYTVCRWMRSSSLRSTSTLARWPP